MGKNCFLKRQLIKQMNSAETESMLRKTTIQKDDPRNGEMSLHLRAQCTLSEEQRSVPSTHIEQFTTI